MSEPSAKLWLVQVDSDLLAARRVWDPHDGRTYCQTLAKFQQATEKSVKAVFAALKDFGVSLPPLGYDHNVEKLISILSKLPRSAGAGLQQQVDGLLTAYHRAEIRAVSALAPKKPTPASGELHRLNTEYPQRIRHRRLDRPRHPRHLFPAPGVAFPNVSHIPLWRGL